MMTQSTHLQDPAPKTPIPKDSASERITETLDLMMAEGHPPTNVAQAFRALLVERARFKAELHDLAYLPLQAPDPLRFAQGVPLTSMAELLDGIYHDLWVASALRLIPTMAASFPKIREEVEAIGKALAQGFMDPRAILKASLAGCDPNSADQISPLAVTPQTLAFTLGQIAKPLIEKLAENLVVHIENLTWSKGYCPICGTMPELAYLQGDGGQRWLRCASCAFEWRFARLSCAFCESSSQEDVEIYFVVGREHESVEVCHKCKRYVLTIDCRNRPRPIAREVAALALTHLDVIAQEKGYLPAAVCAWNIVRDKDISSTPVQI
jgi:FdhE protein